MGSGPSYDDNNKEKMATNGGVHIVTVTENIKTCRCERA